MALIINTGEEKAKDPKVIIRTEPSNGAMSQIEGKAISEDYTKGFVPFLESQKNYVAGQQGGTAEFGNMLGQSVLGALTGTVETIAYWADLDERIGNRFREQKEYENWVGNLMKEAKEAGNAQLPVYKSEDNEQFNPSSREWWMAHGGDTIGSVLGLMVPGLGVAKVGKVAGLGKTGQAISAAVASRTAESTMEANDAFQTAYAQAKSKGFSEEEAKSIASKAGAKTWDSNWAFALQDVMQFSALTKGFSTSAKGMGGKTIKSLLGLGSNMASEGAEEGGQYIVSQEAINAAFNTEEDYFGKDFSKRLSDYIKDDEFKTSVTLGAVGGAVFQGAGLVAGQPLEYIAEKVKDIAKRGLQKEQANSIDDTGTSQKVTNIDASEQLINRLNKGKLNEYVSELEEQLKQPNISAEARETLQNHIEDTKQILTEQSKLKNTNVPAELHKPILLRHLEKNQLTRLDKQLTKDLDHTYNKLMGSDELPSDFLDIKKAQVSAIAYDKLAKTSTDKLIEKKAEKVKEAYNNLITEAKKNEMFNLAHPDLDKRLSTTKDDELTNKTYQLIAAKEKKAIITEELKGYVTPKGREELKKKVEAQKEVVQAKQTSNKPNVTTAEIESQFNKTKDPEAQAILGSKMDQVKAVNRQANKEELQKEVDQIHIPNPEVDINPDITGEIPSPEEYIEPEIEADIDPFANIDPSTLAAFGQGQKQLNPVVEQINTEQEKKEPKPSKLQAKKADKIKNEYLENQTAKTWFREFVSTVQDGIISLIRNPEGYPIEQEYFNRQGQKVPASKVFATDQHGIPLVDTPLVKEGDHVLLKVENDFEYTFNLDFVPTGPENQVINIYWINEDGTLRNEKPLNQLTSSDNKLLTPTQAAINTKLRAQVYASGNELRTTIVAKNIGEAKRGTKLNSIGVLEFDYYNTGLGKLPFNPILGRVDQNGNIIFTGDTVARLPKQYKDKIEQLQHSFPEAPKNLRGSVLVARQSPDGSLRSEVLIERLMTSNEVEFVKANIGDSFTSEDFTSLDDVLYIQNHPVGVYRDIDARTKRAKTPDLFTKLNRQRIHRIDTQLIIPIESGSLKGWAVIEKKDVNSFVKEQNIPIKRYWLTKQGVNKMTTSLSPVEQTNIRKIFDTLISNKQRNVNHSKLNSELPYIDPATGISHPSYYDFLKATNTLQTKLRGSLTPSYGQDTSYSYGQAAIYLNPDPTNIEVEVTPEEEIKVIKQEPVTTTKSEPITSGEIKKPSFTKKKYKEATIETYNFKTISSKELDWFKSNFGEDFIEVAKNVDRFIAENGKEAFGVYYNALVTIAEYAPEGTLYHEAGHMVFDPKNGLISEVLRNKILDEASKIYKIKRSRDPLSKSKTQKLKVVNYQLKSIDILQSPKADEIFRKGDKNNWTIDKILQELAIPKEQQELIKGFNTRNREEILTSLLANYSYIIQINKTTGYLVPDEQYSPDDNHFEPNLDENGNLILVDEKPGIPSQYYSNLTVPGGINYTENEIATPAITPSIKGHAQFSTDNGIGWFRSDEQFPDKNIKGNITKVGDNIIEDFDNLPKTRRILEVQSDLFQKGRNLKTLASSRYRKELAENEGGIEQLVTDTPNENSFLQLLNKDSNWVTFFIKSIIQDSANKGYEKVLFPTGNTASKVEGHSTLEEFKRQKEKRISELEKEIKEHPTSFMEDIHPDFSTEYKEENGEYFRYIYQGSETPEINKISKEEFIKSDGRLRELNQLKQELERVEKEGFGALKPIYNFYENTVTNILKKLGKIEVITDEHNNIWNQYTLLEKDLNNIKLKSNQENAYQDLTGDEQLEEKLMENFERYKLADGNYVPEVTRVQSFFSKLLTFIKKILGFKSAIQKLYEKIDTPNLTKAQREDLIKNKGSIANDQELKFKLTPGFINSEQEQDAISSFKTEVMNLAYATTKKVTDVGSILTKGGMLNTLLEEVRAKYRNEGVRISNISTNERSQVEVDRLATLWATGIMEGTIVDNTNIDFVGTWEDNQYGEFVDKGFKSKVKESLAELGFVVKVNADLLELQTEDEAERLYDIEHTLLNPSNSISMRVKLLLNSIPQPIIDKQGNVVDYERTHLGTIKPLDFRAVDSRLSLKLADSINPYIRLNELAQVDPIAKVILDKLNEIKAKGDIQTFKEVLVKYRRDTVDKKTILHEAKDIYIPIQEREPGGETYTRRYTSRLIDANRNSVFRSIIGDWREEAIRTNFITYNDVLTNKIIAINNRFNSLKTNRSKLNLEQVKDEFVSILKEMGVTVAPELWKEWNALPKESKKNQLNNWVFGERSRSLESLLNDINDNHVSPFDKETGSLFEDLSKASAIYNSRVKTGAYLNEEGELEYPINTPSFLTEMNNIFESKELTEEFVNKLWQDDFYKDNQFLLALRDEHQRSGIRLSLLAAIRDRDKDARMFADRTEIDSIISRFTAFSSNNKSFGSIFIGTPADKSKNPMMSVPIKHKEDALTFLKKVLEGTIDTELVRIKNATEQNLEFTKNPTSFLYIPELNNIPNLKANLSRGEVNSEEYRIARGEASTTINHFIDKNYNQFLDLLVSNDIISVNEEKGKKSITNKRIPKGALNGLGTESFLKEFFYNDTAWRLEMSKVFMGDRAFYKSDTDYFKRAYQLVTPGYKGFTLPGERTSIVRGIFPKQFKKALSEVKSLIPLGLSNEVAKLYEIANEGQGINKTDAQSVATIYAYRTLANSLGAWSNNHEEIYQIAWSKGLSARNGLYQTKQRGEVTEARYKQLKNILSTLTLQPLKPFQYNDKSIQLPNGKTMVIREQYKDSITPLIPELMNGHSGYAELHNYMTENGFDIMSAEDTVKVGLSDIVDLSKSAEERHKKVVDLDSIRYPQLMPEKSKEEVSGTQFHKLIMGDVSDSTQYSIRGKKISGKAIKELYQRLWEDKVKEASTALQEKLGVDSSFILSEDPTKRKTQFIKLKLMLEEELSTRDLNSNYLDALDLARTQLNTIDFSLPLSFPQLGEKFQGILTNIFKKKIFKEGTKSPGFSAVNLADFGVNRVDELKYIRNENDEITEAEIGLPIEAITKSIQLKPIEHYNPSTMRINWESLNENQKKALQMIIYRIPTSNKSSMLPVRVAMIAPPTLNNVVLIPGELTLQMGLDFDVDKSQIITRVIKEGKVDNDDTNTRLFDIYWSILTNPAHLNAMLTPLSTTRLEEIRDKYKSLGILSEESNSPFYTIQADVKAESKNKEEKIKVGISSRAATAHSVFNILPKELINTKAVQFGLNSKQEQLGQDLDESGVLISENLGVVQQAALDAAKTPLLALFNITKNLLPTAETYLLFGKPLESVTDFFMQPIIRKWSELYIQQNQNDRKTFDTITAIYPEIRKYLEADSKISELQFTSSNLKDGLKLKAGEHPAYDAILLKELRYLLNLSKQITNFSNVVSLETSNSATSIEDMLVTQNQVKQATDTTQTIYLDPTLFDLEKAPKESKRLAAFYKHGIEDALTYAGQFYPTTSTPYRQVRQNIIETLRLYPSTELYKKIDQFINFHTLQGNSKLALALRQVSTTKEQRAWSYVNEEKSMYNHIQKLIKKYPALLGNELIKNIRNQASATAELSLTGVRNTDDNSKSEVIAAWEELLSADNQEIAQLGHDLITYSIFTSGFTYHTASFVDLVPLSFWKKAGIDQIWKDTMNNPSIDQEGVLVDFVRHKFESIKNFPQFYLDFENNSDSIVKSSIKQNKEGLITSFVVANNKYNENNLPPRFVVVSGNLYENNPSNLVHYKLLQPAGSRYLYEVSTDGRKESVHPENKGLGSAHPFKEQSIVTTQGVIQKEVVGIPTIPNKTINIYWGQPESETSTKILSNLAPRKFTYHEHEYGSVEHAYQSLKSGSFDILTYNAYNKIGGYGTKIRGKAVTKSYDNLALMKDLVRESFKQNPTSEAAKKLLQYSTFTHNTNEEIDKAFLQGLKLAQEDLLKLTNHPQTTIQFPLLTNTPEGQNQFIQEYLPEEKSDPAIVLNKLVAEETNEQTKQVLNNLLANVTKLKLDIESRDLGANKLGIFEAKYQPNLTTEVKTSIAINSNANLESSSQLRYVITHELVHAYTVKVLQDPQTELEINFNRNIERLAKESNQPNKYEFIAELASNPEFRESLKKSGLWEHVLRFFRKLFNQKESYEKVLDQMYEVVTQAENLQQINPGEFALMQEKKKEPKKRLDAFEKALSSLEAQKRKLKEKGERDPAKLLEANIETLKKLVCTDRSKAVIKYLLIVRKDVDKLQEAYTTMNKTPEKINPKILNPMRDQLLSYNLLDTFSDEIHNNPEAFVSEGGSVEELLKSLANLKNDIYSLKSKTNKLVINRVADMANEALGGKEDINDLRENLQVADRDINWWSRFQTSFSELRDKFIKAAATTFKNVRAEAYRQSQEDLYRTTTKKETASIKIYDNKWVSRVISFNSIGMFKALGGFESWLKKTGKAHGSLADKFSHVISKESLKQDSTGIEFISPWSKEGKEIMGVKEGSVNYPLKQFYETFVLGYLKSQEKIKLPSQRPGLRIPTIGRTLLEGFTEKGNKLSVIKEQFLNNFIERYDDAEFQQVNQHGEPQLGVALRYTARQDGEKGRLTKKEVSLDLPSTVGLFMYEMNKRDGLLAVQDDLELMEQALADRKVMQTTKADSILSGETKGITLANGEYATINGIESKAYQALVDLLDRELYGVVKKREGIVEVLDHKVSIAKSVDALMRFTGLRLMLGKIAIPLTNLLVSEVTLAKELIGGNIISRKNYLAGQRFYVKNAIPVLADLGKRKKETHLGKLLTFFNPMETLPAVGHIGMDTNRIRTIWDKVISTGGSTAEFKMAVTAFGAVMDKFQVINSEGKFQSLEKGVEISEAGKLTLKKGYKYIGKDNKAKPVTELTDKTINEVINYTLRTYQIMNGIYNTSDKPAANAYIVGRLANFMRSWLPVGIAARWNTKDYDQRLGQMNEGHYVSALIAFKNIYGKNGIVSGTLKNIKMLTWLGNNDPETLLLPEEINLSQEEKDELINLRKANIRKTLFELYAIAALGLMIFSAFGGDDDSYTKYMLARIRRELMTFIDPTTAWDVLRSPTVAMNTIETIMGFISTGREAIWAYASNEELPMMERGPGKGQSKLQYKAKRLFGVDADIQFEDIESKTRIILNGGFR